MSAAASREPRLRAALREGERVTPLELFFDLVFVLAFTQCTALMAGDPTWEGLALAILLGAFTPIAIELPALAAIAILAAALIALVAIETRSYGEARDRLRHEISH